jgi:hypothetical protein
MIKRIYNAAAKNIAASKYGSVNIDGEKMSSSKLKEHILGKIKSGGISSKKLEKILKEEGIDKSQVSKRKKLIKMLTGDNEHKMTKKEERRMQERVKMRIAAARRSSEMGDKGNKDVAAGLKARKKNKAGALKNSMTQDGEKVTGKHLGVSGPNYEVSASQGVSGGGASANSRSGGSASVKSNSSGPSPSSNSRPGGSRPIGF